MTGKEYDIPPREDGEESDVQYKHILYLSGSIFLINPLIPGLIQTGFVGKLMEKVVP